jgi:hypothetical protein
MKLFLAGLLFLAFQNISAQDLVVESPILVQNHYYPKPGLQAEVLALRLRASEVRKNLHLVVGRVLESINPEDGKPYVIWEAEYPSQEAREEDTSALDNSEEFKTIQQEMGKLIAKFERSVWKIHN